MIVSVIRKCIKIESVVISAVLIIDTNRNLIGGATRPVPRVLSSKDD
jgi:hypothetical protein